MSSSWKVSRVNRAHFSLDEVDPEKLLTRFERREMLMKEREQGRKEAATAADKKVCKNCP